MIKLTKQVELARPFIAAASGLLLLQDSFYIISDDDLSLFRFPFNDPSKGRKQKLLPGTLPKEKKARKAVKPDFESLVHFKDGILCVPSGSTPVRMKGAYVKGRKVEVVNFAPIYRKLEKEFSELNIEGAIALPDRLRLFQRGNGKKHENATIDIDSSLKKILDLAPYNLGNVGHVPFSFTDAANDAKGIWFLAVAEDSESTFLDGAVLGSALGRMDLNGNLLGMTPLKLDGKPEGLCLRGKSFYVVTDDDDPTKPSRLFKGTLPTA